MVSRGWGRLRAPPCLWSAPPFLPSCSVFWALVGEVLGKRARNRFFWRLVLPGLLHGEGDTVKELRGCQAQVTPSVPFPLSACARACVGQGKSLGSQGTVQLSDGHRHARRAPQGRLQSQDLGKHLTGVEDLLQLHELVEADIAVQAERVRAVSASALRFCDPGKGDSGGRDWEREGLEGGQ